MFLSLHIDAIVSLYKCKRNELEAVNHLQSRAKRNWNAAIIYAKLEDLQDEQIRVHQEHITVKHDRPLSDTFMLLR